MKVTDQPTINLKTESMINLYTISKYTKAIILSLRLFVATILPNEVMAQDPCLDNCDIINTNIRQSKIHSNTIY